MMGGAEGGDIKWEAAERVLVRGMRGLLVGRWWRGSGGGRGGEGVQSGEEGQKIPSMPPS